MATICDYSQSMQEFINRPLHEILHDTQHNTPLVLFPEIERDNGKAVAEYREFIPALLATMDHNTLDIQLLPIDNALLVNFVDTRTTDSLSTSMIKNDLEHILENMDAADADKIKSLLASADARIIKNEETYPTTNYLCLSFNPELGMTREIQESWLKSKISGYSTRTGIEIHGQEITQTHVPMSSPITLDAEDDNEIPSVSVSMARTGRNDFIFSRYGVPNISIPAPPGEGMIINITGTNAPLLILSKESLPTQLKRPSMLATLSQVCLKAEGYGDIDASFDPLEDGQKATLQSLGVSSLSELTPEIITAWSPEQRETFMNACFEGAKQYAMPDIHYRNSLAYLAQMNEFGVQSHRSARMSPQMAERIDMWSDACRKAVYAGNLSDNKNIINETFGVGITQNKPGTVTTQASWEFSKENQKPIFFLDISHTRDWTAQKMLSEALKLVSSVKKHINQAQGAKYSQREDLFNMFASIVDNDYLEVRDTLRKNMNGNVIVMTLVPDEKNEARHVANMLLSGILPTINPNTLSLPDIGESVVMLPGEVVNEEERVPNANTMPEDCIQVLDEGEDTIPVVPVVDVNELSDMDDPFGMFDISETLEGSEPENVLDKEDESTIGLEDDDPFGWEDGINESETPIGNWEDFNTGENPNHIPRNNPNEP